MVNSKTADFEYNLSLTRFSLFSKGIEHLVPLGLLPVDGGDVYEPLEQPAEDDTKIFYARASREEYHDFFLLFLKGENSTRPPLCFKFSSNYSNLKYFPMQVNSTRFGPNRVAADMKEREI